MTHTNEFKDIQWPEIPGLKNPHAWEYAKQFVATLCELGPVTEWLEGTEGEHTYAHMAYGYRIADCPVLFLPHWHYFGVDGIPCHLPMNPKDKRTILTIIKVVPLADQYVIRQAAL